MDIGGLSHVGMVRTNNEDQFLVARFGRTMDLLSTSLPPGMVPLRSSVTGYALLVADGMGGAAAGEVASSTAVRAVVELALETPDWILLVDEEQTAEVLRRMNLRFLKARETLQQRVQADPSLSGMGTTMTLALTLGRDVVVAHVGDSRAYLFRAGSLQQLTRDDTFTQFLVDSGEIGPEEAKRHRYRHVLTDVLGTGPEKIEIECLHVRLEEGDQLLLCTDGLTEMLPDEQIAKALARPGPAAQACRDLVDWALAAGGQDNVTVVLGRYPGAAPP